MKLEIKSQLWWTDGQAVLGRGEWRSGRLGEECGRLFSGLDNWRGEDIYDLKSELFVPFTLNVCRQAVIPF